MNFSKTFAFVLFFFIVAHAKVIAYKDSTFTVFTELDSSVFNVNVIKEHLNVLQYLNALSINSIIGFHSNDTVEKHQILNMSNDDVFGLMYSGENVISLKPKNMVTTYSNKKIARDITEEENNYYSKQKSLPPGLSIINEEEATGKARTFLHELLKYYGMQNDINVYDSIIVNLYLDHDCYQINFLSKIKNHIRDNRQAEIWVSPLNGQILRFYTPMGLQLNRDINYKPKFKYEQVNELIEDLRTNNRLHMSVQRSLLLEPKIFNFKKWVWVLFGLKDSTSYHANLLIIDSNTGEILMNEFDTNTNQ